MKTPLCFAHGWGFFVDAVVLERVLSRHSDCGMNVAYEAISGSLCQCIRMGTMNALGPSRPHVIFSDSRLNSNRRQVAEVAEDLLRRDGRLFHAALSCEFHEGVLTLRGRLPSYYLTQLAQTVVAAVEGVVEVDNRIDVVAPAVPMNRVRK